VTEQKLLDLEREAFLSLCGEQKTLDRIQNMLMKANPSAIECRPLAALGAPMREVVVTSAVRTAIGAPRRDRSRTRAPTTCSPPC